MLAVNGIITAIVLPKFAELADKTRGTAALVDLWLMKTVVEPYNTKGDKLPNGQQLGHERNDQVFAIDCYKFGDEEDE